MRFFILYLLLFIYCFSNGQTVVLKKVGTYKWIESKHQTPANKFDVVIQKAPIVITTIKKQELQPQFKKLHSEATTIKWGETKFKKTSLTYKAIPIKPVIKLKTSSFLFRDNSRYNITYCDKAHGLPASSIGTVTEDDQHNIWMNGDEGLIKSDGTSYYVYQLDNILPSTSITDMQYVKGWGLWLNTIAGFYLIRNDTCYIPQIKNFDLKNFDGTGLELDLDGNIWFASRNCGAYGVSKDRRLTIIDTSCGITTNNLFDLTFDKHKNIWLLQNSDGASVITPNKIIQLFNKKRSFHDNVIISIYIDKDTTWLGTFEGSVIKFTPKDTLSLSFDGSFKERVYRINKTHNKLWFTIYGRGLIEYNYNEFVTYDGSNGLVGYGAYHFFEDSYKNIWISDLGNGISRLNENTIKPSTSQIRSVLGNVTKIRKRKLSNDNYYFHNPGNIVHETDSSFETYSVAPNEKKPPLHLVLDGYVEENGNIWGASYEAGMVHIDKKEITYYSYLKSLGHEAQLSIAKTADNKVWFGTMQNGLIFYNPTDKNFYNLTEKNGLLSRYTNALATDVNGNLLCSFAKQGIQKIQNNSIYNLFINDSLANVSATEFYITKSGIQLIATQAHGLILLKDNQVYCLNANNGLISDNVRGVVEHDGKLWITTDKGLEKVSLQNLSVTFERVYDASFGLFIEKLSGHSFIGMNNLLYWPSGRGLFKYDVEEELKNFPAPIINFQNRYVNDSLISEEQQVQIYSKDKLDIHYSLIDWGHENELTHFALLVNLSSMDTTQFLIGEKGVASISGLVASQYKLLILAKQAHLKFYSSPVFFEVKPLWYNSFGFRICIGIFIIIIFSIFYIRKKNENTRLEKTIEGRTLELKIALAEQIALLQEVHHRVKNNLQFIAAMLKMQINSISDEGNKAVLKETSRRINSMSLVHEMLYNKDKLERVSLKEYMSELVTKLKEMVYDTNEPITFLLDIEDVKFNINNCVAIGMITSEIISNSIKHAFSDTENPTVTMKLNYDSDKNIIVYSINDNGKGLLTKDNGKGLGLRLIDIFSRQMEAEYETISNNGVKYIFKIPYETNEK